MPALLHSSKQRRQGKHYCSAHRASHVIPPATHHAHSSTPTTPPPSSRPLFHASLLLIAALLWLSAPQPGLVRAGKNTVIVSSLTAANRTWMDPNAPGVIEINITVLPAITNRQRQFQFRFHEDEAAGSTEEQQAAISNNNNPDPAQRRFLCKLDSSSYRPCEGDPAGMVPGGLASYASSGALGHGEHAFCVRAVANDVTRVSADVCPSNCGPEVCLPFIIDIAPPVLSAPTLPEFSVFPAPASISDLLLPSLGPWRSSQTFTDARKEFFASHNNTSPFSQSLHPYTNKEQVFLPLRTANDAVDLDALLCSLSTTSYALGDVPSPPSVLPPDDRQANYFPCFYATSNLSASVLTGTPLLVPPPALAPGVDVAAFVESDAAGIVITHRHSPVLDGPVEITYTLLVRAIDKAQNIGPAVSVQWVFDTTPALVAIDTTRLFDQGIVHSAIPSGQFFFQPPAAETLYQSQCRIIETERTEGHMVPDQTVDEPWIPCTSPFSFDVSDRLGLQSRAGTFEFQVRVLDAAGNVDPCSSPVYPLVAPTTVGSDLQLFSPCQSYNFSINIARPSFALEVRLPGVVDTFTSVAAGFAERCLGVMSNGVCVFATDAISARISNASLPRQDLSFECQLDLRVWYPCFFMDTADLAAGLNVGVLALPQNTAAGPN